MKYQFITATTLCVVLSACGGGDGDGNDNSGQFTPVNLPPTNTGGVAETDETETNLPVVMPVTVPPVTQPPVTQPPVIQPPVVIPPSGGSSSQSEDQLLNLGTPQSPGTAWACSIPNDAAADPELTGLLLVFGFYGQGNGTFGFLNLLTGEVFNNPAQYTFDASGNSTFDTLFDDGTRLNVVLTAPNFIDGTNFTASINDGVDAAFATTCSLIELSADADTGTQPEPEPPSTPVPTTGTGDLESRLLNAGTQANPLGGWTCEGILLGFYGNGQGRIGQGVNFNPIQYTISGADSVQLSDGETTGSLSSIQFTGADNFSTLLFDGEDSLGIECTRRELSLAQADSRTTGLSLLKSMAFDKKLALDQVLGL